MTRLSVNVNKIALLRNARAGEVPSPLHFARIALDAGAAGITVHPRPDQRHIRRYDVEQIAELLNAPQWSDREFNIEGNPLLGHYMELVESVRPSQCTLVPDTPDQSTSDHGWSLARDGQRLGGIVEQLHALGCRVSLFMDPDPPAMAPAAETGADRVELYTEQYALAHAAGGSRLEQTHRRYADAARAARDAGLGVNAGHDLDLQNLASFLAIPGILEVSIGHALTAEAIELGMAATVRAYLEVIKQAAGPGAI